MKHVSMKKIKISIFSGVLSLFMLTGCGSEFPDLTDEQYEQITMYAAQLLLSHDTNNKSRLVSEEDLLKKEQKDREQEERLLEREKRKEELKKKEEEEKNKNHPDVKDPEVVPIVKEPEISTDMNDLHSLLSLSQDIRISFLDYSVVKSYPENLNGGFDGVNSSAGNSLLVLKFKVENTSDAGVYMDILASGAYFQIQVDKGAKLNADLTILENDLGSFKGMIGPIGSDTKELVLIKEYPTDTLELLDSIVVIAKKGSDSMPIKVK